MLQSGELTLHEGAKRGKLKLEQHEDKLCNDELFYSDLSILTRYLLVDVSISSVHRGLPVCIDQKVEIQNRTMRSAILYIRVVCTQTRYFRADWGMSLDASQGLYKLRKEKAEGVSKLEADELV